MRHQVQREELSLGALMLFYQMLRHPLVAQTGDRANNTNRVLDH